MDGWVDGPGWVDGWMGGWVDGWIDGWMDGWTDGWMDIIEFLNPRRTDRWQWQPVAYNYITTPNRPKILKKIF